MNKILIYTVHKAASTFLHKLTADISSELGIRHYSVNYQKDYTTITGNSWRKLIQSTRGSSCFGPIRLAEAKPNIPKKLDNYSIILHLRDPRDVLTSLYFSLTYSHKRKKGRFNPSDREREQWERDGIDNFILQRFHVQQNQYSKAVNILFPNKNVKFVRYEDMVMNFSAWLEEYISAFSAVAPPARKTLLNRHPRPPLEKLHRKLYKKYKNELTPPRTENIRRHVRQITPGDHKRKLQDATIERLNREFEEVLQTLGYM